MNITVEIIRCNNQLYTLWEDKNSAIIRRIHITSYPPSISGNGVQIDNHNNYNIFDDDWNSPLILYIGNRPVINLYLLPDNIYLELLIELLKE